jgi:SAM-dependent methyltransferase
VQEKFDQAFWDDRYRSKAALWSGNPNRHLVTETVGLNPGWALDVGSGEGADAIWLAEHGWRVTAVDVSTVALARAATHAAERGAVIAERIDWLHQDLMSWTPPPARYDLVSAQYMQLPTGPRQVLFDRLATSVASGGTLLIVGHHPSDMQTTMPRPHTPELFFTGDDIAASLDPNQWAIITNASPDRTAADAEGRSVTIHDTVLRAHRRSQV